ncbi:MAG: TGS domain-containing protein, partial [Candidatus Thermoplasmatota archaeon]
VIRDDITADNLVDHMAGNRVYLPAVALVNKVDLVGEEKYKEIEAWLKEQRFPAIPLAAAKGWGIEKAKDFIFDNLHFMRVHLKPRGGEADMVEPLIVKSDTDVGQVCDILHREFRKKFRYAQVWGKSAKFPGQTVGIEHKLKDGDILTIITRIG